MAYLLRPCSLADMGTAAAESRCFQFQATKLSNGTSASLSCVFDKIICKTLHRTIVFTLALVAHHFPTLLCSACADLLLGTVVKFIFVTLSKIHIWKSSKILRVRRNQQDLGGNSLSQHHRSEQK